MSLTVRILLTMLSGFVVNLAVTPVIIHLAHRNRWYDETNHRKVHTEEVPRLGGFGIFLGMLVSAVVAILVSVGGPGLPGALEDGITGFAGFADLALYYAPVLLGMIVIHFVGLIDDFRDLRAVLKFVFQIIAAVLVTVGPFRIERITIPFIWYDLELGLFSYPVTIVWIVAISNAVNFIDGIDGLAGGTTAITVLFVGVIALIVGQGVTAMLAVGLFGTLVAFLVFNGPPARIFMGDSGSYILGFIAGVLPLILADGSGNTIDMLPAITLLALPILDMTSSILRRMRRGRHPFGADREHVHHKLMDHGLNTWSILLVLYSVCIILGITGVAWYLVGLTVGVAITAAVWGLCILLVVWLSRSTASRTES
jgi:UDP-GlcNAc:undecaprenyl-phosphate GlcNAc-1-phosphate transferase